MATLKFLDPPKSPDQFARERWRPDDPRNPRVERIVKVILWALSIAGLACAVLITMAMVKMYKDKAAWISEIRAQYTVESITVVGGAGRTDAVNCWSGSTVHLVVRLENQKVYPEAVASAWAVVTLSGGLDSAPEWGTVAKSVVVQGSSMPKVGNTLNVPFSVEVPAAMQGKPLTWTALAMGNADEPPNRGRKVTTIHPCAPAS